MLFQIWETWYGDQEGVQVDKLRFDSQADADLYCEDLTKKNECYLYFAIQA